MDKKKEKAPPEKFFRQCVGVWFRLYGELLPQVEVDPGVFEVAVPSFVGAETLHMKSILTDLRVRAEKRKVTWTEEEATKRFEAFIKRAWEDSFIQKNFMLRIISNNRTKIFNNQISKNGTNNNSGGTAKAPITTTKPKGGFGKL